MIYDVKMEFEEVQGKISALNRYFENKNGFFLSPDSLSGIHEQEPPRPRTINFQTVLAQDRTVQGSLHHRQLTNQFLWTVRVYEFLSFRNQIFGQDFNLKGVLFKNIFPKNHEISNEKMMKNLENQGEKSGFLNREIT